jgi:hypothetical protein
VTLEDADGAYFGLFPVLLSMLIKGNITPVEQNGGEGDYLWTFAAPQTGAETLDSITLEVGDDQEGYEMAYGMLRSLRITGDCETGEVHVSGDLFADEIIQTTVTAGQTPPTVELCNAKLATIDIDSTWAGLGTTPLTAALVNFDILINGGGHPKFVGSAQRKFDTHGQGAIGVEATFTFERIAGVATEELLYRPATGYAVTARFVRLTITGTQIGAGDPRTLVIDMAGIWDSWHTLGADREGNTLDVAKLVAGYDVTGTQALQATVTTAVTAI